MNKCFLIFLLGCLAGFPGFADVVHVFEQTEADGQVVQISDRTFETGWNCTTLSAPEKSGWIFTQWEISTAQAFENRDEWGRALDQVSFVVYEDTTLTACYVPKDLDDDGDGVADGHELYWYGNLGQGPNSDTDGDGVSFADELAAGRNPLMAETADAGPIVWVAGAEWLFNPNNYGAVTIRSEPEGLLFATTREVYRPGTRVSTTSKGIYSPETTTFAYWSFNGDRLADEWGRAEAEKTVVTDGSPLTIVAHAASDYETRMKLYWYGRTDAAMTSDTDGDGRTLAEELAAGTNPLMAETKDEGPVKTADGVLWQYNPYNYQPYTMKSDPEGALFPTESYYVRAGTKVVVSAPGSSFYGWQVNGGEIRRDEWGRSEDSFTFTMPGEAVTLVAKTEDNYETRMKLYWYGTTDVEMTSDTDGDGKTFAEEVAVGRNPLMAEMRDEGPVVFADTETEEFNLQPYEQVTGAVVDEKYEVFPTFGGAVTPTIADIDGDGKLDIVVEVAGGETVVYLGCGSEGNPEFKKVAWRSEWEAALVAAKPRSLDGPEFDVKPPTDAMSWSFADVDGNGVEDLLVSDGDGRIWYYRGMAVTTPVGEDADGTVSYQLQHKVWGGSFAGFAEGLRIAAVDWDDDGDLDCLCGTAEGRLMLLRNPKVGRPTNVKTLAGVDNVLLEWDPNAQSRVRGYRVYRKDGNDEKDGNDGWAPLSAESSGSLLSLTTAIPRYRDYPPTIAVFDYRVTSVSQHYVAGNSTPIESESMPTEAVRAEFGMVKLAWNDAAGFDNEEIKVSLAIENSLNVAGDGLTLEIAYDAAALKPVRVETSGLTEGIAFTQSAEDGTWTVRATGGKVAAGGGTLFTFVFEPIGASETGVSVRSASMKSVGGATIPVVLPEGGAKVTVAPFIEPEPAHASVTMTESVQVTAGESFEVAVAVSGEGVDAASLAYDFSYDTTLFTRSGNVFTAADVAEAKVSTITLTNVSVKATDGSAAVVDSVGSCAVAIAPLAGGDVGSDGDETDDPEQGVVYDKDGELVDWGDEPQEGSAAYGFGFRLVNMNLGSVRGKTDEVVEVPVGIHAIHLLFSTTVDVSRWAFSVCYDADLLEPVGITAVQGEYDWSAANGVMTVVGKSGKLALGKMLSPWQYPLKLKFKPVAQYARHDADLRFKAVQGRTVEGKRIYTPVRTSGSVYVEFVRPVDDPTVVVPYGRGDVTGDGRLAKDDLQLMAQLMQSSKEKWNDRQLGAGDYNGNGKLDNDDYQLMRADFRAKGIVNGGEKMGVL